jgi:hypothetical protein
MSPEMGQSSMDQLFPVQTNPPAPPAPPAPPTTQQGPPVEQVKISDEVRESRSSIFDSITKGKSLKKVETVEKTGSRTGKVLEENTGETTPIASSSKITLDNTKPTSLIDSLSNKLKKVRKAVNVDDDPTTPPS